MTKGWRGRSISSPEDSKKMNPNQSPQLNIEFEVGRTLALRPDCVVRGYVLLTVSETSKTQWVSSIKIKFRGEETASARVRDSPSASGTPHRMDTIRTIFFECVHVAWSCGENGNTRVNEYCPWKELVPGEYKFPFALNIPPVNFPPSIEGPRGFSIRYVWQPVIEGAGGSPIEGPEIVTPFIPISFAPMDQEWSFKDTLYRDENRITKRTLMDVEAKLPKHVFSPGEELKFALCLRNHSVGRITCVQCSLRKHYEGPLDREFICGKHERSLVSTERRCDVPTGSVGELNLSLQIPRKHHHAPPTFTGRHLRVYYTLRCVIQAEMGKFLTKMQYHEVIIPISLASYPHVSDEIVSSKYYPSYSESRLGPFFFDPEEDLPPNIAEPIYPSPAFPGLTDVLNTYYASSSDHASTASPYYSENDSSIINDGTYRRPGSMNSPGPLSIHERVERTIFTTRSC